MPKSILPRAFASLEPFCSWSLETESLRNAKRISSEFADITVFYEAMITQMPSIIDYLRGRRVGDLCEEDKRLFWLGLALMEVSPAVELFGLSDVPFAVPADRMAIMAD